MRLEDLIRDVTRTEAIYWENSYARVFKATVLRGELEKRKVYLILDRTGFHPKSGGQPSDGGHIQGPSFKMEVRKAMVLKGVVIHWGKLLEGQVGYGEAIGEIDWDRRYLYMRRHTGGHLLDHCLTEVTGVPVETTDAWHGESCYVGYRGEPPADNVLELVLDMANQWIVRGASVKIEFISRDELLKRSPDAPNIYRLPPLESYRIVTIKGCKPIPCGGTHLRDLKEINGLMFKGVKESDLGFRLYYDVE